MRRIINSTFITLDGVIANPHTWPSGRVGDPAAVAIQTDLLRSCDAVLMGRHTYDSFAAAWPTRSGDPYSDQINSMTKYVVSSTLQRERTGATARLSAAIPCHRSSA
jgi:dihydrofolate reductase